MPVVVGCWLSGSVACWVSAKDRKSWLPPWKVTRMTCSPAWSAMPSAERSWKLVQLPVTGLAIGPVEA